MPYFILKTLHILGVTVWIGGMSAILVFYAMLGRRRDGEGLRRMLALGAEFGQKVIGPAVGVALLAAILLIVLYDVGMPLWIWLGIGAMTLSMALGGALIRKRSLSLIARLEADGDYAAELRALLRLALINLLILVFAVAVMVIKPA